MQCIIKSYHLLCFGDIASLVLNRLLWQHKANPSIIAVTKLIKFKMAKAFTARFELNRAKRSRCSPNLCPSKIIGLKLPAISPNHLQWLPFPPEQRHFQYWAVPQLVGHHWKIGSPPHWL